MNRESANAAFLRLTLLLGVIIAISGIWEFSATTPSVVTRGEVIEATRVGSSATGDPMRFIIRYHYDGRHHDFTTRRSLVDQLVNYRALQTGETVPVRVNTDEPGQARLDSLTARFPITLSFLVLLVLVWITGGFYRLKQQR